jgi:antitoxin component YwqK of YwqJK toxin-antitoxin module
MKTFLIAAISGLSFVALGVCQANSWEEDGLRGNVKRLSVQRTEISNGTSGAVEGARKPVVEASYTTTGQKTEESRYSSSGALLWTFSYVYDEMGRRTSTECRFAKGQTTLKLISTYASDGRKEKSVTLGPGGVLQEQSTYSYDAQGNNVEVANLAADGSSVGRWTYAYNEKGRVREWIAYDANGGIVQDSAYSYDSEGRLKVTEEYGANNTLERKTIYDSKGNEIEVEKYSANGAFLWKRQFEYTFDEAGNWTRKITKEDRGMKDFTPVEIDLRTLEYY